MFGEAIGKFRGERIGVFHIDEGIPPHVGMTLGFGRAARLARLE